MSIFKIACVFLVSVIFFGCGSYREALKEEPSTISRNIEALINPEFTKKVKMESGMEITDGGSLDNRIVYRIRSSDQMGYVAFTINVGKSAVFLWSYSVRDGVTFSGGHSNLEGVSYFCEITDDRLESLIIAIGNEEIQVLGENKDRDGEQVFFIPTKGPNHSESVNPQ